jgi:N utilization substance protein B
VSARSKARKRALDVLFEADQRGRDPLTTLADWTDRNDPPVPAYADLLVRGVAEHAPRIDEVLSGYTTDWPLERLPSVDRAVLRLATFELLWSAEVPAAVAIDEAVELAKSLSTDASPGFVNGVLARVLADREQLVAPQP